MVHGPDARAWARSADAPLARAVADVLAAAARSGTFPVPPETIEAAARAHGLVREPWPGPPVAGGAPDLVDVLVGLAPPDVAGGAAAWAIAHLGARGLALAGAGAADAELGAALAALGQGGAIPIGEAMAFEPALDERDALWRGFAAPALKLPPAPPHPWAYGLLVFARSPEDAGPAAHRAAVLAMRARGSRAALVLAALRGAGSPGILRALLGEPSLLDPGGPGEKLLGADDPRDLALGVAALYLGAPRPLETLRRAVLKRLARGPGERDAAWLTELYALAMLAPTSALRERMGRLVAEEVVERADVLAAPLAAALAQTQDYRLFRRALLAADAGESLARRGAPTAAPLLRAALQVFTRSLTPVGLNHPLHDELFVSRTARALAALFGVDEAAGAPLSAFIDTLPALGSAWGAGAAAALGLVAERCAEVVLGAAARASTSGRASAAERLGAVALRLVDRHGRRMWGSGASGRLLRYRAEGLAPAGVAAEESRRQSEREPPQLPLDPAAPGGAPGRGLPPPPPAPAPAPAPPDVAAGPAVAAAAVPASNRVAALAPAPPPAPASAGAAAPSDSAPAPALAAAPAADAPIVVRGRLRAVLPSPSAGAAAWARSLWALLVTPFVRREVQLTLPGDGSIHVLESLRAWPASARIRRATVAPGRLSVARVEQRLSLVAVVLRALPLVALAAAATVLALVGAWDRSVARVGAGTALLALGLALDVLIHRRLGDARARSLVFLQVGPRLLGVQLDRAHAGALLDAMGYGKGG